MVSVINFNGVIIVRFIVVLCLILCANSIGISQSTVFQIDEWTQLSVSNIQDLTPALEFSLADMITQEPIQQIDMIPHTTRLFLRGGAESNTQYWQIWDINTRQMLLDAPIQTRFKNIMFSSFGKFMAIATENPSDNLITDICLWDIELLTLLNCWEGDIYIEMLFTPDERLFLFPMDNTFVAWDTHDNALSFQIPQSTLSNALSPNGEKLALYDAVKGAIYIWDTKNTSLLSEYHDETRVIVSDITFDETSQYLFFMAVAIEPNIRELGIWDTLTNETRYIEKESFTGEFFSNIYGRIFLFRDNERRSLVTVMDVLTEDNYGIIDLSTLHDYTLAQDIFIARESSDTRLSWIVKNFETQETLFILYENADDSLLDVRFTQDERFIIAYTEDGLVQLWGVRAEN